jgi:basic membrane lipoprotein Med (substrate-binding protein (PBP1-ABC) superfamily)
MRNVFWAALAAVALFGGAASADEKVAPVKVGVICAGNTVDGGWNQQGADAATAAAKGTGGSASVVKSVKVENAADVLRDFAKSGVQVAICHGFEYLDKAEEVAKSQDKMKVIVTGCNPEGGYKNIYMLDIDIAGPSYQLGVLAGKTTKSGKLAFIAGSDIPPVAASFAAFEAGAKSVRPDVAVAKAFTSWDEPVKSKAQAEAFIQQGADVIFQNLDTASRGVFEAITAYNEAPQAGERKIEKVWVLGCNADQNDNKIAGKYTLASAVIRIDLAFEAAIKMAAEGKFAPGAHKLNINNGETQCVLNPKLTAEGGPISKDVQKLIEETGKKIIAGEIKMK